MAEALRLGYGRLAPIEKRHIPQGDSTNLAYIGPQIAGQGQTTWPMERMAWFSLAS